MLSKLSSAFHPATRYDVCIIGAGAAGITLARKLGERGYSVLLAEAGGLEYSDLSQSIYRGPIIGDPYIDLDEARLRFFGGSTNHWGGVCQTLDPHDFKPKAYTSYTSWPIEFEDLDPYLEETREILGIRSFRDDVPLPGTDALEQMFWRYADRPLFAESYLGEIKASPHISLLLNANFMEFELQDQRAVAAKFLNYDRHAVTFHAKSFIVACGGIENSRIFLMENRKWNNMLGNSSDMVGKYFMDHPHFTIGEHFLYEDHPFKPTNDQEINLTPTLEFMMRSEILNSRITLDLVRPQDGWRGFVQDTMCNVAPEISAGLLEGLGRRFVCGGTVRASWEQEPRADNRIALTEEVDYFGNPRVAMLWQKSELDRKTFTTLALKVGQYLVDTDGGRLRLDDWVLDGDADYPVDERLAGRHHMGGTRMASSPRHGVVDRNCRVFGVPNLFVAGSSVFPNGGQSNPTLTIVELSLRLADFLAAELPQA